jgi:hypothetical protein
MATALAMAGMATLSFLLSPSWSQSGNWTENSSLLPPLPGQTGASQTLPSVSLPTVPHGPIAVAPAQAASAGTTMMASVILSNGFQQIAVLDQPKRTMAVYHVDPSNGDIQLKSVRKLDADFSLEEFNLSEPTPSTIRKNVR